jgi:hypothetical protein
VPERIFKQWSQYINGAREVTLKKSAEAAREGPYQIGWNEAAKLEDRRKDVL